jgi:ASCH domain
VRALSVRQPWAELIILGHKTIEVRSRVTHLRERIWIYAGQNRIEAEEEARIAAEYSIDVDALPRGVLVGTVEIIGCRSVGRSDSEAACFEIVDGTGFHAWVLDRPERAEVLEKPTRQPQPMFFNPF